MTALAEAQETGTPQARVTGVTGVNGTVTVGLQVTVDLSAVTALLYTREYFCGEDALTRFHTIADVVAEHASGLLNLAEMEMAHAALAGGNPNGFYPPDASWRQECTAKAAALFAHQPGPS